MTSTLTRYESLDDDGRQADFNTAVDALLAQARGWRFGAYAGAIPTRHKARVTDADDRAIAVQYLLDELCARLGICLPPRDQVRLRESPPLGADEFTDAVFRAEGLEPAVYRHLRRDVRATVDKWMPEIR